MIKVKYILPLVAVLLAATACSKSDVPITTGGENSISADISRAGEAQTTTPAVDGNTFRFMLYQPGSLNYKGTGTYVYDVNRNDTYLTAAGLDKLGENPTIDPTKGLNGVVGTFGVLAVSPGLEIFTQQEGTEEDGNLRTIAAIVTCPNRVDSNGDDAGAVWVNDWEEKVLGEYDIIKFSTPMREIRSKIRFEIRKDPNLAETMSVQSIKVMGAGTGTPDERLYCFPQTRQCAVPDGVTDEMDFGTPTAETDSYGSTYYKTAPKYILSGIYAPRSVTTEILGTSLYNENVLDKQYLTMHMDFMQGSRKVTAEVMLNADAEGVLAELKSRNEYVFKVEVSSTYIKIYLHIYDHNDTTDWQQPSDNGNITIDDGDVIEIGTFTYNSWNNNDLGDQIIDNDENN